MAQYPLTKTEARVLKYVTAYLVKNAYSPTYQEIADGLRMKTRQHAKYFIQQLVKKERLTISKKATFKHRKIRLP